MKIGRVACISGEFTLYCIRKKIFTKPLNKPKPDYYEKIFCIIIRNVFPDPFIYSNFSES